MNNSNKEHQSIRILGVYLIAAALLEVGLAIAVVSGYSRLGILRIGILLLLPRLSWEESAAILIEVLCSSWLFLLGVFFLRSKRPLKTYVLSEVLLSAPTVRFAITMLIEGGSHVFPMRDAWNLLLLSLMFSGVPLIVAILAIKEGRRL